MASSLETSLLAQLETALQRLTKLEAEVATLRRPASHTALVEALARAFGEDAFVGAEVRKRADADPRLGASLTAALGPDWNPKKLGNLLADIRGKDLGGYMVVRLTDKDRAGSVWMIRPLLRV